MSSSKGGSARLVHCRNACLLLCLSVPLANCGAKAPEPTPCRGITWEDEVCIPGGTFSMGHAPIPNDLPDCQALGTCGSYDESLQDFTPAIDVKLDSFFIDKYPATVKEYRACVDAGSCPVDCLSAGQCGDGRHWDYRDPALDSYPALGLSYEAARSYCEWKAKRLPFEAEWERAARGPDARDYPWGNEAPDCSRYPCNPGTPPFDWRDWLAYPVGSIPGDKSAEGVMEMVTNGQDILADRYVRGYADLDPAHPFRLRTSAYDSYVGRPGRFGSELYHDTKYPSPAWFRVERPEVGGVRCARSDDDPGVAPLRSDYARKRQELLRRGGAR